MAPNESRPAPAARRRRRRRWAVVALLLSVAGLGWAYRSLSNTQLLAARATRLLSKYTKSRVLIGDASFSMSEGLRLSDVAVFSTSDVAAGSAGGDAETPYESAVFRCGELHIECDLSDLLPGRRFRPRRIVVNQPQVTLVRDAATQRYNVSGLFNTGGSPANVSGGDWPVVEVQDARLRLVSRRTSPGGPPSLTMVEELKLDAVAMPAGGANYDISWRGGRRRSSGTLRLDLATFGLTDVSGGSPWISLEGAAFALGMRLPQVQAWAEQLGLTGELQIRDFRPGDKSGAGPPHGRAVIAVTQGQLAIPYDDVDARRASVQRFLRFDGVECTLTLAARTAQINLSAKLRGSPCKLTGKLTRAGEGAVALEAAGFDLRLTVDDLVLPSRAARTTNSHAAALAASEADVTRCWARLASFYNDFDPHGRVSIDLAISRAPGPNQPIVLTSGRLTALDCDASYRHFPYRVSGLTGSVEFSPSGVSIRDLSSGDHAIVVSGELSEPRWWAGGEIRVRARGAAVDAKLRSALNERYGRVWDQFDPRGMADIDVTMSRPPPVPGTERPSAAWKTHVEARLIDVAAAFTGFPYPVNRLCGLVTIDQDQIEVSDLSGSAGDAQVSITGVARITPTAGGGLELKLTANHVPVDDVLRSALPPDARQTVETLGLAGRFDLDGVIRQRHGELYYELAAHMADVSLSHRSIPLGVSNLSGLVRLEPQRVEIVDLHGRHGDTEVTIRGVGGRRTELDKPVTVALNRLPLDAKLRGALSESQQLWWDRLNPSGTINLEITLGEAEPQVGAVAVELLGVSLRAAQAGLPLDDLRGRITIADDRIHLADLTARCGNGRASLTATLDRQQTGYGGPLQVSGRDIALDQTLRQSLPWRWRRLWNDIQPSGTLDVELAGRVTIAGAASAALDRSAGDSETDADLLGSRRVELTGDLHVEARDAALSVGVDITEMNGRFDGAVSAAVDGGVNLAGTLALQRANVEGRPFTELTARLVRSAATGSLRLHELRGRLFDGIVDGDVEWHGGQDPPRYAVTADVRGMQLDPFLEKHPQSAPRGTVEAHLYLTGEAGRPASRQGGGRVLVRKGRFVDSPLGASLFENAKLRSEQVASGQDLSAEFFLTPHGIDVQDLRLEGDGLVMVGAGTIQLPGQRLNLALTSGSPRDWPKLPVVSELIEGASGELMEFYVSGTFSNPQVTAGPFRGPRKSIESLFERRR